eukprot:TRINITY_DN395_c0_g2_i4.p1 TRINITY_DN395_c0_g2~~TRINITY_DN395_c0_g2_i4.p1  ORF type:complete len:580 (+),score=165.78 TRINITY_DN395_c0_g2_i4:36-1742(+)
MDHGRTPAVPPLSLSLPPVPSRPPPSAVLPAAVPAVAEQQQPPPPSRPPPSLSMYLAHAPQKPPPAYSLSFSQQQPPAPGHAPPVRTLPSPRALLRPPPPPKAGRRKLSHSSPERARTHSEGEESDDMRELLAAARGEDLAGASIIAAVVSDLECSDHEGGGLRRKHGVRNLQSLVSGQQATDAASASVDDRGASHRSGDVVDLVTALSNVVGPEYSMHLKNSVSQARDDISTALRKSTSRKRETDEMADIEIAREAPPTNGTPFYQPEANAKPLTPEEERLHHCFNVVSELYHTEKTYIKDLELIIWLFLVPLRGILTEKELKSIFCNIEQVYDTNKLLLENLASVCENITVETFKVPALGTIFLNAGLCDVYNEYCKQQEPSRRAVAQTLKEKESFRDFIAASKLNTELKNLDMEAYLVKPVQRICRYPLLLRELLKCLPPDCPERPDLEKVKSELEEIPARINESMAMCVKVEQIKSQMYNSMDPAAVDGIFAGQDIIRHGEMTLVRSQTKKRRVEMLLLSQKLVMLEPGKVPRVIDLHTATFAEKAETGSTRQAGLLFILRCYC